MWWFFYERYNDKSPELGRMKILRLIMMWNTIALIWISVNGFLSKMAVKPTKKHFKQVNKSAKKRENNSLSGPCHFIFINKVMSLVSIITIEITIIGVITFELNRSFLFLGKENVARPKAFLFKNLNWCKPRTNPDNKAQKKSVLETENM